MILALRFFGVLICLVLFREVEACKRKIPDLDPWSSIYEPELSVPDHPTRHTAASEERDLSPFASQLGKLDHTNNAKLRCNNLLPGIMRLSRGKNLFFTPLHENETDHVSARIFDLSCESLRTFKHDQTNYSLPDQLDFVDEGTHSLFLDNTRSFRNYEELRTHLHESWWGLWTSFIKKVVVSKTREATNRDFIEQNAVVTTIVTSVEEEYVTRLALPAVMQSLTKEFVEDCTNLPINGFRSYFEFIRKYGTHVQISAVLGGRLNIVVRHDSTLAGTEVQDSISIDVSKSSSVAEIKRDVYQRFNVTQGSVYVYTDGGKQLQNKTVDEWIHSLMSRPTITGGDTAEVIKFCPSTSESQRAAFAEVLDALATTKQLRIIELRLRVIPGNPIMTRRMLALVHQEMQFKDPRKGFAEALSLAMMENEHLEDLYIEMSCQQDGWSPAYKIRFLVLNAMCMTLTRSISECTKPEWSFSTDHIRLEIYQGPGCMGHPILNSTHTHKLTPGFRRHNSLKLSKEVPMY